MFCPEDIYKILNIVLEGQWNLLLIACFYVLKLVICATLTTMACESVMQEMWSKADVQEMFQNICKLGAFVLAVGSILELLYAAFPDGFADELEIMVLSNSKETPKERFDEAYFVIVWAVTMGNCSMVVLREFRKAYAEYESSEIPIDNEESNLVKFIKKFRGSKDETTDSSDEQ